MKRKPECKIVSMNNDNRFSPLYACHCPDCKKLLKRTEVFCEQCKTEIDWSEFE